MRKSPERMRGRCERPGRPLSTGVHDVVRSKESGPGLFPADDGDRPGPAGIAEGRAGLGASRRDVIVRSGGVKCEPGAGQASSQERNRQASPSGVRPA